MTGMIYPPECNEGGNGGQSVLSLFRIKKNLFLGVIGYKKTTELVFFSEFAGARITVR
jgi:hypothetical protein